MPCPTNSQSLIQRVCAIINRTETRGRKCKERGPGTPRRACAARARAGRPCVNGRRNLHVRLAIGRPRRLLGPRRRAVATCAVAALAPSQLSADAARQRASRAACTAAATPEEEAAGRAAVAARAARSVRRATRPRRTSKRQLASRSTLRARQHAATQKTPLHSAPRRGLLALLVLAVAALASLAGTICKSS